MADRPARTPARSRRGRLVTATVVALMVALAAPAAADRGRPDWVGVARSTSLLLRDATSAGPVSREVRYGLPGDVHLMGDWNGDGRSTPGVRRGDRFLLRDDYGSGALTDFAFGDASDTPVVGDWDGDGRDTIGIRRDDHWMLRNTNSAGPSNIKFRFGDAIDTAVVGDWSGDGRDTIGIRRGNHWMLRNTNSAGPSNIKFRYGDAADRPLVGHWRDGFTATPLPASVRARMSGVSWRSGCPVGLDDLAHVRVRHHGFDGRTHDGELVVAAAWGGRVAEVFRELFHAGFPLKRVRLVDDYGASDDRAMAANTTSAFNCRRVAGTSSWSQHAYGTAIDINPVQNPYVRGATVSPPSGAPYVARTPARAGMIVRPGPVLDAFARIGWRWGGDWTSSKDYQHLSANGR